MGILELARRDFQTISSNKDAGFAVDITFTANTAEAETATVAGLHTKHHLAIDPDLGTPVNSKNAHVTVSEQLLLDAEYPVRNDNGEVDMKNHLVVVKDSTGEDYNYIISEFFPDETLGVIVFILRKYGTNA
jgi:hypothetical protein